MIYRYDDVILMLNIYILLFVDMIGRSIYVDMIELSYFIIMIIIINNIIVIINIIVIVNIIISVSKVGIKSDDVTAKRYDRTILTHLLTLSHTHRHDHHSHFFQLTSTIVYVE